MTSNKTGLAFSGGGIRSAALCSGVLRRLLKDNAKVDYLSCVSGGGYTGTSFLDWKYRKINRSFLYDFPVFSSARVICHLLYSVPKVIQEEV